MSKKFNIHDWQAKQRLTENVRFPGEDEAGMAARHNDLESVISKYIGQTFASWMSPDHPPFSQEYNKPPYFDKLIEGIMKTINDHEDPAIDEQNTLAANSGNSVTTGDGMGYMSPNAFGRKRKKVNEQQKDKSTDNMTDDELATWRKDNLGKPEPEPEPEKVSRDVELILRHISRINTKNEFTELFDAIMDIEIRGMSNNLKTALLRNKIKTF